MRKVYEIFGPILLVNFVLFLADNAFAAGGKVTSPTAAAPDRYVYYPGTEELDPDEMRVVACGTGMPSARHGQGSNWATGTSSFSTWERTLWGTWPP
jgi:hypothetical protein